LQPGFFVRVSRVYFATRSIAICVPICANAEEIWLGGVSMKKLPAPPAIARGVELFQL
jgi:hypothetical protein